MYILNSDSLKTVVLEFILMLIPNLENVANTLITKNHNNIMNFKNLEPQQRFYLNVGRFSTLGFVGLSNSEQLDNKINISQMNYRNH